MATPLNVFFTIVCDLATTSSYSYSTVPEPPPFMGSATGLKLGGPKPLLNMKVSRSLILIYIKLYKILIHAFKY